VEVQKVPESMVQSLVSGDLAARVSTVKQQVLSQSRLQPVVERVFPGRNGEQIADLIDNIRSNFVIEPVPVELSTTTTSSKGGKKPATGQAPAFYVKFTAPNPREAQQVCTELTTLVVDEYTKQIAAAAGGTNAVLDRGIEDAKSSLDIMDSKLATFKKQYVGQLPGDEENNLKILSGLNSQLESNTQTLNRAQQDKSYAESMLAQQLAAWRSLQSSTNPDTLQKQLSDLQAQLLQLRAKYTDDHPDVIKAKADIAGVKNKLAEVNKTTSEATDAGSNDKASATEPPEIRQLRLQIHQYGDMLTAATRDQKRLQEEINVYQGRISLSPAVEEQYKQLTRDYDNSQRAYADLLAKKSTADLTVKMNNQAEGERMFPVEPANLPDSTSFPNRPLFAAGGLGAGLAIGIGLALWLEIRDKSIRTESDAEAVLQLPTLVAVPWVGVPGTDARNGGFKFWQRNKRPDKQAVGA
jgi:uncharacterized protein involved in exopolysaccharide biosynthesis